MSSFCRLPHFPAAKAVGGLSVLDIVPVAHKLFLRAEEFAKYCDTVERTAEWGGEPEVRFGCLALTV